MSESDSRSGMVLQRLQLPTVCGIFCIFGMWVGGLLETLWGIRCHPSKICGMRFMFLSLAATSSSHMPASDIFVTNRRKVLDLTYANQDIRGEGGT